MRTRFRRNRKLSGANDKIYRMKKNVLFICVHNSARSQMAEAFLNVMCSDYFEAQSAGLEPGTINPLAVEVMDEVGIFSLCHHGLR